MLCPFRHLFSPNGQQLLSKRGSQSLFMSCILMDWCILTDRMLIRGRHIDNIVVAMLLVTCWAQMFQQTPIQRIIHVPTDVHADIYHVISTVLMIWYMYVILLRWKSHASPSRGQVYVEIRGAAGWLRLSASDVDSDYCHSRASVMEMTCAKLRRFAND